jgi:hypothetical protein
MARNVVNSRFSFARNFILAENTRLRSLPLHKAAIRWQTFWENATKKLIKILIMRKLLIIFFLTLLNNILYSQPKDTIYGKLKSIREQLIFLDENRQNLKLFSTEGDYGHNGFLSEEYTKSRFNIWWYQTYWVHYINYYKEFDINDKLLKVVWHYKDQSIMSSCENKYDIDGKLIVQEFNSYNKSKTINTYDKNNNLILSKNVDSDKTYSTTKKEFNDKNQIIREEYFNSEYAKEKRITEYYYDISGNVVEEKKFDEHGDDYGTKFEYDLKNRKTKIINHSPFIWVKTKTGSSQKRTKNGNDQISREFKYDEKDRIIETKSYNSNFNDGNIAELYRKEVTIYEDDLVKNIYSYDNKDSLTFYKTFEYDKLNRKTKEFNVSPKYPDNNISLEYFYNETEYPIKLLYLEKGITAQVDFDYVFDDKKNWVEQRKSVNGKKLYIWKRELKYFE